MEQIDSELIRILETATEFVLAVDQLVLAMQGRGAPYAQRVEHVNTVVKDYGQRRADLVDALQWFRVASGALGAVEE